VTRSYDIEVAMIYRRDLGQLQTLGDCHHRSIDDTQRKIQILAHQFGHPRDVVVFQFSNVKPSPPKE
jgi:hypothetical protein